MQAHGPDIGDITVLLHGDADDGMHSVTCAPDTSRVFTFLSQTVRDVAHIPSGIFPLRYLSCKDAALKMGCMSDAQ